MGETLMQLTQVLRRARQIRGRHIAVTAPGGIFTWDEFAERVARLAGVFAGYSVAVGDRIAILAHSSHRYAEAFFAAPWIGAIAVPLNTRLALPELLAIAADASPVLVLTDRSFASAALALAESRPSIRAVIFADDGPVPGGMMGMEAIMSAPAPDAGCGGGDVAAIFYTGGTTGLPKGVMMTHDNLFTNSLNLIGYSGVNETSVTLHCGPWFHLAAAARVYSTTIVAGRHVILPRFEPGEVLAAIDRERVTVATFVPTMLGMLLHHPDFERADLSSLEYISYGGAPMPEALIVEAMEKLPHVRFAQAYGMTELSPVATFLSPRDHAEGLKNRRLLRSGGRAVFNAEVKIVDTQGHELPRGEIGEIVVRGPMVMKGYWGRPEATAEAIRDGWMHTGDAGRMDEDGYIYVEDRVKDMIVSGGENVYSIEVENAIYLHPAIAQCAVIGIPHPVWGEAVHAVVTTKAGESVTPDELIAHCRELIAGYKAPKSVEVRTAPLPLSSVNKIHKAVIRAPYWQGMARQVN
jgi:long-chain acyl-CoA synthetase